MALGVEAQHILTDQHLLMYDGVMTQIPLLDQPPAALALRLGQPEAAGLARLGKALSDPGRLGILGWLAGGEQCVCDLCDCCGMGQSLLSHHLKVLKEAGLVADRREGRWAYYRLTADGAQPLAAYLDRLAQASQAPAASAQGCC